MTTNPVKQILTEAREMYAAAPDHAPLGHAVEPGHVCPVIALERAWVLQALRAVKVVRNRATFMTSLARLAKTASVGAPSHLYNARHLANREAVIRWNAESSTEDVLAAFDKAILAS